MQTTHQSDSRKLFEFIATNGLEAGTLYTLKQLSDVIGKHFQTNRTPIYSAIRLLEKNHSRTLVCITNVGYRVAQANETKDIVDNRVTRATKQVRRAKHTAIHTDKSALTPQERKELDATRSGLVALERQMTQVHRRMKQIDARIDVVETTHDERLLRLEEELTQLRQERRAA